MRTHLDLFSGIGGFALACRWNNIQTVGFVEYEDYPRRILGKQFPGVPLFGDIRDFDATPFRGVDLITGGYPCQPFSQAGKRKGKEDVRHLWPEMFRVITQARPSWVLAENVAGHINLGLDEVLLDLESEGYTCRTVMVPACGKNALHIRQRCWIIAKALANTKGNRTFCATEESECNRSSKDEEARLSFTSDTSGASKDVADTGHEQPSRRDEVTERQQSSGRWSPRGQSTPRGSSEPTPAMADTANSGNRASKCGTNGIGQKTIKRQEKQSQRKSSRSSTDAGQSSRSTQHRARDTQPGLGRTTNGLSEGLDFPRRWGDGTWEEGVPRVTTERKNRTARLKALGNAIVPQIAYELIRCTKAIDESF